jgi:hypothetical protein
VAAFAPKRKARSRSLPGLRYNGPQAYPPGAVSLRLVRTSVSLTQPQDRNPTVCGPGEGHMPGDPSECREHAKTCLRLAAEAHNPQAKQTFKNLAETWLRVAADLEAAKALLKQWGSAPEKPA